MTQWSRSPKFPDQLKFDLDLDLDPNFVLDVDVDLDVDPRTSTRSLL